MWIDKLNRFSNLQALTATAASTDILDLGADRDVGNGEPIELVIVVGTALTSAGASTLVAALQTDSAEGFGTVETLIQTPAIPKASLVAGYEVLKVKLPLGIKRYLRVYYTVGTADFTAGTISAFLTPTRQAWKSYASGYSV